MDSSMSLNSPMDAFWDNHTLDEVSLNLFDAYIKRVIPDCTKKIAHTAFGAKLEELKKQDLDENQKSLVDNLVNKLKNCSKDEENTAIWSNKRQRDDNDDANDESSAATSSKKRNTGSTTELSNASMYLKSGGSFDCSLKLQDKKWIMGETDMSSKLMELRKKFLDKGLKKEKMTPVEILTFNNIFFFSRTKQKSVTKFFSNSIHNAVTTEIKFDDRREKLPAIVNTWLSNIKDIAEKNKIQPVRDYLLAVLNSEEVKNDKKLNFVANTLYSLAPKFKTWTQKIVVEDTFVKNQFADALDVILGQDDDHEEIEYEWCNKKISTSFLKPNYTIKVEGADEDNAELFVIEVKAPMRNRSSNDFIKIAFTMKDMLDKLIKKGVEKPIVTGLLIDAYDCFLYHMSLEYEGVYIMTELLQFQLPKTYIGFPLLKDLFEAIFQAKEFIIQTAQDLDESEPLEEESPLTRPSFLPTKDPSEK